jgi:hypothetical protein
MSSPLFYFFQIVKIIAPCIGSYFFLTAPLFFPRLGETFILLKLFQES